MASKNDLVYLEDVEPVRKQSAEGVEKKETTTTSTLIVQDAQKSETVVKRQRSIAEMFPSQASSSKRQKMDSTSPATSSKSLSATASLNSIPLNLDSFRASLTEETRELLALELETMGKSWLKVLLDEIKKPYFTSLKRWLASEGLSTSLSGSESKKLKIFPPAKDIYTWSQTPLGQVRVVIVGQDPYHAPGQAHGLSFSVPKGVPPPPSLKNIYAEMKAEYPEFVIPKHGNLSTWAASGVVLLNTCLTVRAHEAGSHSNKGWEQFTDRVISIIDRYGGANLPASQGEKQSGLSRGVVFLAWGSWAQKRVSRVNKNKHLILTSAHPSPLSAHKGFLGNNHFKTANAWLEKRYGKDGALDWCKLD